MKTDEFTTRFFRNLADPAALRVVFDYLPSVYFFVKDRAGRIVAASPTILQRLGMTHEREFIGKRDDEVYPARLAAAYRADDELVFRTGRPLIDRLEVWLDESRRPDWCVTTKIPLRGKCGEIIGLMGISRRDVDRSSSQPVNLATRAVAYLRLHLDRIVTTEELAESLAVSVRTLNRKINEAFQVSPYELMLRLRIQSAAEQLLATDDEISQIAMQFGFCDQSAFTQHFRKRIGLTPRQFRHLQMASGRQG